MKRVLLVSDTHFTNTEETYKLSRLLKKLENKIDICIISGDILDSNVDSCMQKEIYSELNKIIDTLDINFIISSGNTDNVSAMRKYISSSSVIEEQTVVTIGEYRALICNSMNMVYETPSKSYDIAFSGNYHNTSEEGIIKGDLLPNMHFSASSFKYEYSDDSNKKSIKVDGKSKPIIYRSWYNIYTLDEDNNLFTQEIRLYEEE